MYTYVYVTSSHKLEVIVSKEMSNNECSFILNLPHILLVCMLSLVNSTHCIKVTWDKKPSVTH